MGYQIVNNSFNFVSRNITALPEGTASLVTQVASGVARVLSELSYLHVGGAGLLAGFSYLGYRYYFGKEDAEARAPFLMQDNKPGELREDRKTIVNQLVIERDENSSSLDNQEVKSLHTISLANKPEEAKEAKKELESSLSPPESSLAVGNILDISAVGSESRSGEIWEYMGEKPNPRGGKLRVFKSKLPQSSLTKPVIAEKSEKMFPALEPFEDQIRHDIFAGDAFKFLSRLGYAKSEHPFEITLPDHDALKANWHHLQQENRTLPNLDLASFDGNLVDDEEFARTLLSYGAILSDGKEFVHDTFYHVIPLLLGMRKPKWEEGRAHVVQLMKKCGEKVRQAIGELQQREGLSQAEKERLIGLLYKIWGMYADIIASNELPLNSSDKEEYEQEIEKFFLQYVQSPSLWQFYWCIKVGLKSDEVSTIMGLLNPRYRDVYFAIWRDKLSYI